MDPGIAHAHMREELWSTLHVHHTLYLVPAGTTLKVVERCEAFRYGLKFDVLKGLGTVLLQLTSTTCKMRKIVVLGGGISGLAAAWRLCHQARGLQVNLVFVM